MRAEIPKESEENSELVIGLVGALGCDIKSAQDILSDRLRSFGYSVKEIRISKDVIEKFGGKYEGESEKDRLEYYMNQGNKLRKEKCEDSFLALGAIAEINQERDRLTNETDEENSPTLGKSAFIINSLKHPSETEILRSVYSDGFFQISIYEEESRRTKTLIEDRGLILDDAEKLIRRDENEKENHGQHTRDTFHLSDFFVNRSSNSDKFKNDLWRFLDLIFSRPFVTPTFDEFAMFMAFSSSLRSADLSRQVGAVISKDKSIVSSGANDVPAFGGGLYWPIYNEDSHMIEDKAEGRDYKRGYDSNASEKKEIIDDILSRYEGNDKDHLREVLRQSNLKHITEYGRIVHAEMEALLACGRNGTSTVGTTIFCTTFPCHNCAKHIISAGVKRVVYVEPYAKSKAFDFHSDAISEKHQENKVYFEPFVGVGPRSFFNLFSMNSGRGKAIKRKSSDGKIVDWNMRHSTLRMPMVPSSYLEREKLATAHFAQKTDIEAQHD